MFTKTAVKNHLAQNLFWDEDYQTLWLDMRKLKTKKGVLAIQSWDRMMLASEEIPDYPPNLDLLNWTAYSDLRYWLERVPAWILESCKLFESHQLSLLHYSAKYPRLLEILDHAPFLAWQLVSDSSSEEEKALLLQTSWTNILSQLGLTGEAASIKFIRSLRLRQMDKDRIGQIYACLADNERLDKLQELPRVNSFALALATHFPDLIAHRLHHSLASIPCRPNQCQAMVFQLQDFYSLANHLGKEATDLIGSFRYLIEVEELYLSWWQELKLPGLLVNLTSKPQKIIGEAAWQGLSKLQAHPWWLNKELQAGSAQLWAWQLEEETIAILVETKSDQDELTPTHRIIKSRIGQNKLLNPSQQVAAEVALNTYIQAR